MEQRLAGPAAQTAGLGPRLAAAAARWTRSAHGHVERDDKTAASFNGGQLQFGRKDITRRRLAQKAGPHPSDDLIDRREIDRDLVSKAVLLVGRVRHGVPLGRQQVVTKRFAAHDGLANDRRRSNGCQGTAAMITSFASGLRHQESCLRTENVRSARARCDSKSAMKSRALLVIPCRRHGEPKNGPAPIATTMRKLMRRERETSARVSARRS
jgi:hypothetical protein